MIDLKTFEIDGMKISDIFDHTSKLKKFDETTKKYESFDKYRYNLLKEKHKLQNINNPNRWWYKKNNYEDWEKKLIMEGILIDEVIKNNENRDGFYKDRDFEKDGKKYQDEIFSTLMLGFAKILEEDSTLAFFNTNEEVKSWGEFFFNPLASDFNSNKKINAHPDFLFKYNNHIGNVAAIEQKCVYKENFEIKIRESQMRIFDEYEEIYILIKREDELDKDTYYFYSYNQIKKHLKPTQSAINNRTTYSISKEELDKLEDVNVEIIEDRYIEESEYKKWEERRKKINVPF